MTIVRRLGVDDVPVALAALANSADRPTHLSPDALHDALTRAAHADGAVAKVVISHDNVLLGVALVELPENAQGRLDVLWVHESVRRRHLARALLASLGQSWKGRRVIATLPEGCDRHAVRQLLGAYSFKDTSRPHVLLARPVNTHVGRASLIGRRGVTT